MDFRTKTRLKLAFVVIGVLLATFTLVLPLINSILQYQRYQRIVGQNNYVNASIRTIENKQPFMQKLIRGCYIKTTYEFVVNGKAITSQDNLDCKYDSELIIGNTLPVYYGLDNPAESVTTYAQIQKPLDLFVNSLFGFIVLFVFIAALLIIRHSNRKAISRQIEAVKH